MADHRWTAGELVALIDAWRPVYNRRRAGIVDVWVPPRQRARALSTRDLATEDWRGVAISVNSFRADINLAPIRTHRQCKTRVERLKRKFGEQLATPSWLGFVPVVSGNTATRRRYSSLNMLAAAAMVEGHGGGECCGGGAGGQAGGGGSAAAEGAGTDHGGAVMSVGGAAANTSDGVELEMETEAEEGEEEEEAEEVGAEPEVEVEEGGTATPPPSVPMDRFTAAGTGFFGGPIPKKRRTGASTSTSDGAGDGRAPSVKEELVREENARRAPVDDGPAPAGGFAATAPAMAAALGGNDAAVVGKLAEMFKEAFKEVTTLYTEVTLERIAVQRQKLAATMGGAAVPEPDAAHA